MAGGDRPRMKSWRDYWDADNPIYVNDRHKTLHYRLVARDIVALVPSPSAHVLDHGSGEALSAGLVTDACEKLFLCDAAPTVRAAISARFVNRPAIMAVAPEIVDLAIPDDSLDLVVSNSLLQYLSREEFTGLLALWLAKLKPGGTLVVADVIPPGVGPLTDARALLSFAWEGGFLLAALSGLVRTALSDYRTIRGRLGLSMYTPAQMDKALHDAGFTGIRQRDNMGHNPARMSFVAYRPA